MSYAGGIDKDVAFVGDKVILPIVATVNAVIAASAVAHNDGTPEDVITRIAYSAAIGGVVYGVRALVAAVETRDPIGGVAVLPFAMAGGAIFHGVVNITASAYAAVMASLIFR